MAVASNALITSGRTVDRILAEWRDADLRLQDEPWNAEQAALVEQLCMEYEAALASRSAERDERSRPQRLLPK